ncbi:MAG: phosphotransferase [Clostridia bacterium]|nr:phosphotransferase [Clostridia bacterium]
MSNNVSFKYDQDTGLLTIFLSGRIDSVNSPEAGQSIQDECDKIRPTAIHLDCDALEYISSAGLRIILRVKKACPDTVLTNVSSEVYEILETTGFTEMMDVQKGYRRISVDGCELIGQGANGQVYRMDRDTIVKVYRDPDSLPDIQRERELARKAFVLGIPTAIPYDVVRVGEGYGSVFELLNTKSFAKILIEDPSQLEHIARMSVDLLKIIHGTEAGPGEMPDMKAVALGWADYLKPYIPADRYEKLHRLIDEVPFDLHILHGDFHIKNVMLQDGEALLIDMDTLCTGNPVFEFGSVYNAYIGFGESNPSVTRTFIGVPVEQTRKLWELITALYYEGMTDEQIEGMRKKARIIGYTRILRRCIRREEVQTPEGKALYDICERKLFSLLDEVDTLLPE